LLLDSKADLEEDLDKLHEATDATPKPESKRVSVPSKRVLDDANKDKKAKSKQKVIIKYLLTCYSTSALEALCDYALYKSTFTFTFTFIRVVQRYHVFETKTRACGFPSVFQRWGWQQGHAAG